MDEALSAIGHVISVGGAQVSAALTRFHAQFGSVAAGEDGAAFTDGEAVRIGSLVKMKTSTSTVYGVITKLATDVEPGPSGPVERDIAEVDLMGEVLDAEATAGRIYFERGVSVMPTLGLPVAPANSQDVKVVYAQPTTSNVRIGTVHQDKTTPAYVMINDLLAKHIAILGTTGSGKSCAVALILRKILTDHPAGHVILLDPHNEYRNAFGDLAEVIEPQALSLPCWLLNIDEIASVLVRAGDEAEQQSQVSILKDAILDAKKRYAGANADTTFFTPDTPVPYRLTELIRIIDNNMGKLDKADTSAPFLRLKARLEQVNADNRFGFMFSGLLVRDSMPAVLSRVLRIPVDGRPLTIVDMSGVPSEIVDVVVSVVSRLVFEFAMWSDRERRPPMLLVCEEAHRYIPEEDSSYVFKATKMALSRIAKEGRKYGVSLCLVSQRPSELSAAVVSQCGTLFALRMNNHKDQAFVEAAMPENGLGLLAVLPALRRQEAVVVGEGVTVPMRLRFDTLAPEELPRSGDAPFAEAWTKEGTDPSFVLETIDHWRRQHR
jgi:DNA helicase HerA-like ATPase